MMRLRLFLLFTLCGAMAVAQAPPAPAKPKPAAAKPKPAQDEFAFGGDTASRGYFDNTERNLFEGQDLDVPTWQRQGLKIVL